MSLNVTLLCQELGEVSQWDILGLYLGLSESEVQEIEAVHPDTEHKRRMFDKWLNKEENPSWAKITTALENMSLIRLANQLRYKYQAPERREAEAKPMPSNQVVIHYDPIGAQLEDLKESYDLLAIKVQSAVVTANLPPIKLERFSRFYFGKKISTTEEFCDFVGFKFKNCFDLSLVEKVVKFFFSREPIVDDLDAYRLKLEIFKSSYSVRDLIERIMTADTSKDGTLSVSFDGKWLPSLKETLSDLMNIRIPDHTNEDIMAPSLVNPDATQEAIQQEVEMCVSNLVVSGSPGSGKTCVVNLSVGEPAPDVRNSTGCVETPVRAIAHGTICFNGTKLEKLETKGMLRMVCQAMRHKVDEIKNLQVIQVRKQEAPTKPQLSSMSADDVTMPTESSENDEESLHVFSNLVAEISSVKASDEFLTAHLILTIDSGGQPHFMDVAPLFLRNSSLFLLTVKLNERLDSKPKFDFFIKGQPIEMSNTELQPTNLQLIEQLAKSISSLQLLTTPCSDGSEHAKFMIVGTFADKAGDCQDESVADKNSILRVRLKDYEAERIDEGNDVIFAINAVTTDPDERREAALRLQDKITKTPGTTIKKTIKLRWFGLLLHLLDEAEKKSASIIPLEDVLAAGRCLQMHRDETLQAIAFFHELNLLMYFLTDKLGSIVFIHVKPILSKVSNLIGISFIDKDKLDKLFNPNLPTNAQRLLRNYGRFSREILDSSFQFSAPLTTDVFLDLLEHLCVIARIEKEGQTSFFLPCALPHAPEDILQEKEQFTSLWIVTLQTRRGATLVDVPIPKGYLPTLAVHLLNSLDFEADLKNRQYRNLMSIHYVHGYRVYLLERTLQLEIYYPCAADDEELRKHCSIIRSAILNTLVEVEKKLHFVPNILIKNDAFLCSCKNGPRHICVYNEDCKRTRCDRTEKPGKLSQQQQCWLQQQPGPVTVQLTTKPPVVITSDTASANALKKEPKMRDLLRRVASKAMDKWKRVGLELDIEEHQLNTITHPDPIECYSKVFSLWKEHADPPFTWGTIIEVLRSPVVRENALAQEIEDWLSTTSR